jgi:group II intron reverse transcriptase/maturase
VAQTVVARRLEERVEPIFHPDSYGYRPGRSPIDAVQVCRRRCWRTDWVIDLDIQAFFDSVPKDLVVKAVEANTDLAWVVLYVKRWLQAPVQHPDGSLLVRDRGTPQGSAISPVIANLFLHYAFDAWMAREYPAVAFERYVDDVVVHCVSERQARTVLAAIAERMSQVGLRLHPAKTRIVYCQDDKRRASYEHTEFTFLGFTFRQRGMRSRSGRLFSSFNPAISKPALKKISGQVRSWRLHNRIGSQLVDIARDINPVIRGWMAYYGSFYRSAMYPLLSRINAYLVRWIRHKYKRLRAKKKAFQCWRGIVHRFPRLFAHWAWTPWVPSVW